MKVLTENELNGMITAFKNNLSLAGLSSTFDNDKFIEVMKKSSCGMLESTGCAYEGSLIAHINMICNIGENLRDNYWHDDVPKQSLYKVCCLQHISKTIIYTKNPNQFEIDKYGKNYVFANVKANLTFGERSLLIATKKGITFTAEELEAMLCFNKEDGGTKINLSPLSLIVKQANEMAFALSKFHHI